MQRDFPFPLPSQDLTLGDRPIKTTLNRLVNSLSMAQKLKMAWGMLTANADITPDQVEQMKDKDMLEQLMQDMAGSVRRI